MMYKHILLYIDTSALHICSLHIHTQYIIIVNIYIYINTHILLYYTDTHIRCLNKNYLAMNILTRLESHHSEYINLQRFQILYNYINSDGYLSIYMFDSNLHNAISLSNLYVYKLAVLSYYKFTPPEYSFSMVELIPVEYFGSSLGYFSIGIIILLHHTLLASFHLPQICK